MSGIEETQGSPVTSTPVSSAGSPRVGDQLPTALQDSELQQSDHSIMEETVITSTTLNGIKVATSTEINDNSAENRTKQMRIVKDNGTENDSMKTQPGDRGCSQMRSSLGGRWFGMMTSLYFPILFVKNFSKFDDMRQGQNPKFLMRSFVSDP